MKLEILKYIIKRIFSWNGIRLILHKSKRAFSVLLTDGPRGVYGLLRQFIFKLNNDYLVEDGVVKCRDRKTHYPVYDSEYQTDMEFPHTVPDIKAIAFYLPQFHSFPENDEWWGKGFTEWTNTKACNEPRFEGHYQPREPHSDIGFYDLSDFEVMRKQVELAKNHGIYGFCYYYYWFSGKRLMERPVDQLLEHPEVEMPFCLCWANENWTRAWDGQNRHILIKQQYDSKDNETFILDIKRYLDDSRYIRVNGKPVIIVYNPGQIPDCSTMFATWRDVARSQGIGEILIFTCATANNNVESLKLQDCVDGEVEFPPHNMWFESIVVRGLDLKGKSAQVYNYDKLVDIEEERLNKEGNTLVPLYHACTLGWDNSPRRKDNWFMLYAFSLHGLYRWMRALINNARRSKNPEDRFVFINAWNEWAEGTYLEPDARFGYASINTVSKALYDMPFDKELVVLNHNSPWFAGKDTTNGLPRIAVHLHLFYPELADEMAQNINEIPYAYDLYITTDTKEKKDIIERVFTQCGKQHKLEILVVENWGRDVRPFLLQMRNVVSKYEYICHLHGKKTKTGNYGGEWREYCLRNLLGSKAYLERLFYLFESNKSLGLVFPATFPPLLKMAEWGGDKEQTRVLLNHLGCNTPLPNDPIFPVGNMFWARTKAIIPAFEKIDLSSFPAEAGQTDATIAHCIERCWVYLARSLGYDYCQVFNSCLKNKAVPQHNRLCLYVHYDRGNRVCEDDLHYLHALRNITTTLVVISNCGLDDSEKDKLSNVADLVIVRENKGCDFGAWRDGMASIGWDVLESYDEVVLANNSVLGPFFDLSEMFSEMGNRLCDFWGGTLFPTCADGSYLNLPNIPEHIQSFFMVFHKNVVMSKAFSQFWKSVQDEVDLKQVIAKYETQLTGVLAKAGFAYEPYIRESYYMDGMLGRSDLPYSKPWTYLLLRFPFVKKKYVFEASDEDKVITASMLAQIQS